MRKVMILLAFAALAVTVQISTASAQMVDCRRVPMQFRRQVGCPMPRPGFGLGLRIGPVGIAIGSGVSTGYGQEIRRVVGGPEQGITTIVEHPPGLPGQYRCWTKTGQPSGGPGSGDGFCVRH